MAIERNVTFLIGANAQQFIEGVSAAQKNMRRFGRRMQRIGSTMTQNVTAPLTAVAGLSLKAAADFEKLEQSLSILNGSAEAGARVFEDLKNLSAGTPFQLQDLARAQQTLQGFSLSAEESFESIQMIGDIAAVTGGDIQSIAVAFGQSAAEGKLFTRDIRQLINQGVPAVAMLADTMGVAEDQIFDMASEGKISFEIMRQAFQEATSEGGRFADGMEKQSQTLSGIFSTLRDNVSIALGELGESIVETFDLKNVMKDIISSIQNIVDAFKNMSKETKRNILIIAGALGAAGPLAIAIGTISTMLAALMSPITAVIALFAGVVTVGQWVYDNWNIISANFVKLMKGIQLAVADMVHVQLAQWGNLFSKLMSWLSTFAAATNNQALAAGLLTAKGKIQAGIEDVSLSVKDLRNEYEEASDQAEKAGDGYVSFFESLGNLKDNTFGTISNLLGIDTTGGGVGERDEEEEPVARTGNPIERTTEGFKALGAAIDDEVTPALQKASAEFDTIKEAMKGPRTEAEKFSDELANNIVPLVSNAAGQIAGDFIEMSVQAAVAGESLGSVFLTVLTSLADLAIRVGKIAIGVGIAVSGIKKALESLNPIAAIAAGAALVALGVAAKAALQSAAKGDNNAQGMQSGGIVPPGFPNDTYPAMLTSGETVIPAPRPLPKRGGGMAGLSEEGITNAFAKALSRARLKASGTDLQLVLNNSKSVVR